MDFTPWPTFPVTGMTTPEMYSIGSPVTMNIFGAAQVTLDIDHSSYSPMGFYGINASAGRDPGAEMVNVGC